MLAVLTALADPTRLKVVEMLAGGERSAGEIERALGINQPAASKHLKSLRLAGLVAVRKDAQRRLYRLQPEPLAELDAWLSLYRPFWSDKLDALERHLDQEC
ncbi:ArsR/SmtB family transcription factor [Phenylobacterium montanum]|uniref:Winged helix-turn-helix transcriptional regulator n=1 Tax=Phenylobacterium montanum TaxID=2823693 RepID=A0A975FVW7_9CAUL|nr:metalloregulator ArsR/SmtB family transcription factor [Caulobacter sp. S6]QUD86345.1 winged helix-turn-helix transcriptional regulator [Caulobacter sp. S6]